MNPVTTMRSMVNAMHVVYAVNTGVKLGLFDTLASFDGPVTIPEFVGASQCNERYIAPWLRAVQSAGIVDISENAEVEFGDGWREALTDRDSSNYLPPMLDCHLGIASTYNRFPAIFRGKDALPLTQFDRPLLSAIAEDGIRFANFFLKSVVDAIPNLRQRLEQGGTILDVGCGGGKFLAKIAQAFPKSTFIGVDQLPRAIEVGQEAATEFQVPGRVSFRKGCATQLFAYKADCIILNEVLHEMDPAKRFDALMACRGALNDGGALFVVDIMAPDNAVDYAHKEYELSALVQFFEAPWGSSLLTRKELRSLLEEAGFGPLNDIVSADNVVAAFAYPRS